MNQVFLVGRLIRNIEVHKSENGVKVATIPIAVTRSFKNIEGIYETDFVDCTAFESIAANTQEYCQKGDTIGIKGRLQTTIIESEDGKKTNKVEVIAEKISFLASKPRNDIDQDVQSNEEKNIKSKKE